MTPAAAAGRYSERAVALVARATVVELLGSFLDPVTRRGELSLEDAWLSGAAEFTAEDHAAVAASGIDVFAIGELRQSRAEMLDRVGQWNAFIAANHERLERVDDAAGLRRASSSLRVGVLLSFQDSVHFETADDVNVFLELGQRVSQLTYNGANRLGCGAFVAEDTGLTAFGREIVARMNEVGMAVDLSHCGDRTTLDAIAASSLPVLITHAACRALNPGYPRAKTDEAIRALAAGRGVIGIPTLRFMVRDREPVTPEHVLDHVEHVARLVGVEHVAIGTDTSLVTEDAEPLEVRRERLTSAPPEYRTHSDEEWRIGIAGLDHPLRTYDIVEGLLRRGWCDAEVELAIGGNAVRVLGEIFGERGGAR